MAITKPRGDQLDIASVATELTTDAGALAVLDAEYIRTDNSNGGGFVDLTTAQDVGGAKRFTDDVVVVNAAAALTLNSSTAGNNSLLQFSTEGTRRGILYYSVSTEAMHLRVYEADGLTNANQLIIDQDGTTTAAGNFTVTGNLTVSGTITTVNTTDLAITDNVILVNDGEAGAGVSLGSAGLEVDRGTSTNQQLIFNETTDKWQVGEIGSLLDLATESYVDVADALKLNLTGGTLTGTLNITPASADAVVNLTAVGNPLVYFNTVADGRTAHIVGYNTNLHLRHTHTAAGASTDVRLYDDYIDFNKPVIGVAPTSTNHLTRKDYVDVADALKLNLTGGTLTGSLSIDKASPFLNINADLGTHGSILFKENADQTAYIYHDFSTQYLRLQKRNAAASVLNEIQIRDVSTYMVQDPQTGSAQGTAVNSLTRKDYVDDNFLDLTTSQTVATGVKTFINGISVGDNTATHTMAVRSGAGGLAGYRLYNDDDLRGIFYAQNGADVRIRYYNAPPAFTAGSELTLADGYIASSVEHRGVDSTFATSFTTRGYVDGAFVDLTTNQDIAGGKTFTEFVTVETQWPGIRLFSDVNNHVGSGIIDFRSNDAAGTLRRTAIVYGNNANDSLELRKYDRTDGTTITNILKMQDSSTTFSTGATFAGGLSITGNTVVQGSGVFSTINSTANNAHLQFQIDGVRRSLVYHERNNERLIITTYAIDGITSGPNIVLHDSLDRVTTNARFDGIDSTAATSFTTRGYVDTTFVNLTTTQSVSGFKTFEDEVTARRLKLEAAGGGNGPYIVAVQDGTGRVNHKWNATFGTAETYVTSGEEAGRLTWSPVNLGTGQLILDYAVAGTAAAAITWINLVSIGSTNFTYMGQELYHTGNVAGDLVEQPAAYEFVMPSTIPTPNQSLSVDTVVGTVVTMKWV